MKTRIYDLTLSDGYCNAIQDAAQTIKDGGLVVFPTETVYGLGANALDEKAVSGIFMAKGRPSDNPLIVHVADVSMIAMLADLSEPQAKAVVDTFMPGPITIVLKKNNLVPYTVTAGLETVAIRMPNEKYALDLIRKCQLPIAAPSANISGKPSPTRPEHVLQDMDGKADVILLGENCLYGIESTVLDCTVHPARILRPGAITQEQLAGVIELALSENVSDSDKPKSPGMKYNHYKPNAAVIAVKGNDADVIDYINRAACESSGSAVLGFSELKDAFTVSHFFSLGNKELPQESARVLFAYFRECDRLGVETIYVMCTENEGIGRAYLNRLLKAADQVIEL